MKKRRRHRRRNRYLTVLYALGLTVIVGIFGIKAWETAAEGDERQKKAKNIIVAKAEEGKKTGTQMKAGKKETVQEEPVPDRTHFAVEPGKPVGSAEPSQEKVVYLTMDDGPSDKTIEVLKILDKYKAKATFFVTSSKPEYAYLIKEAYDKGHTIGLHTYSHDYAALYASEEAYFNDLQAIGNVVKEQIGYVPCFIRFPGGTSNTVSAQYSPGIMTSLSAKVQEMGYQYYDWNCSSADGGNNPADALVTAATSCGENNVVLLMHDASAKQTSVDALPRIIEHYQGLGYEFRALDRESFTAHHAPNN